MFYRVGIVVVLICATLCFLFTTTEQAISFLLFAIFGQLCVIEELLERKKNE